RSTLISRGNAMFRKAAKEQLWWHNLYMQNHLWVNICGLAAAGLAVFEETDDALLWVGMSLQKLETTLDVLGPDGASHEGVGYWEYGAEHMLKLMDLARDLLAVDLYDTPWWKSTARYSLYLTLPRSSWSRYDSVVNLADSPRHHWYGPDQILRHLAATYDDGHAQWLAGQIDSANVESSNAQWLNLIWYDPAVAEESPQTLPTLCHFTDMGIVSARTNWTGDESLVVFKCGPFIGHKAIQTFCYDPGGGHTHPDAGHFVLFGNGEWLIQDDGVGPKWTSRHNTLLIDGAGQLGEGGSSFLSKECLATRARPRVLAAESNPQYDYIAGDVAPAYPQSLGLKRYVRHLLFLKPDVLLVLDDVLCDSQRDLELRFHPAGTVAETIGNLCTIAGERTSLRMELLTSQNVTIQAEQPTADDPTVIRCLRTAGQWRNVVALSWASVQSEPRTVVLGDTSDVWEFLLDGQTVTFDWELGTVTVEP
ncbi:MAG: heparinase II/III family protein, partial [Solirubrobacterales bacterium]